MNPANFGRIDPSDWRDYPDHYTRSIWPDVLPSKPVDYGVAGFHGRTHPEIIKVALNRYTKPGDTVWDCFAGGGTTIDVCLELGCDCVANDINPTRSDIVEADSRYWRPDFEVDMVVMHPPYLDIIDWPGNGTLAVSDVDEWLAGMRMVMCNVSKVLKLYHVLVVILGQVYVDRECLPLEYEFYPLLENYRILGRVVRGFGETMGGATSGMRNENLWKYRRLKYGIWSLGIDTVLFLQRLN